MIFVWNPGNWWHSQMHLSCNSFVPLLGDLFTAANFCFRGQTIYAISQQVFLVSIINSWNCDFLSLAFVVDHSKQLFIDVYYKIPLLSMNHNYSLTMLVLYFLLVILFSKLYCYLKILELKWGSKLLFTILWKLGFSIPWSVV